MAVIQLTNLTFRGYGVTTNGSQIIAVPLYSTNITQSYQVGTNGVVLFNGPLQQISINLASGVFTNPGASFQAK